MCHTGHQVGPYALTPPGGCWGPDWFNAIRYGPPAWAIGLIIVAALLVAILGYRGYRRDGITEEVLVQWADTAVLVAGIANASIPIVFFTDLGVGARAVTIFAVGVLFLYAARKSTNNWEGLRHNVDLAEEGIEGSER